ncbi:hypothetical protein C5746_04355 [Streptomyces atratus]|uniref:Uncharacterized protein n=1 Tax=Streptomyces atratus TaxID=1893 RepID=A0A2Z5J8U9_STRAR|nr:hypothetical protein C5746_04355 [Streptomyces atratus]
MPVQAPTEVLGRGRTARPSTSGCHDSSAAGLHARVIVGEHGQTVTYERDVARNSAEARCRSQMWLHDKWSTQRQ